MADDTEALTKAYWKLREHASSYRDAKLFRQRYTQWATTRDGEAYRNYITHEFYARGIEAGARTIAELIGVPECEIEPADGTG